MATKKTSKKAPVKAAEKKTAAAKTETKNDRQVRRYWIYR